MVSIPDTLGQAVGRLADVFRSRRSKKVLQTLSNFDFPETADDTVYLHGKRVENASTGRLGNVTEIAQSYERSLTGKASTGSPIPVVAGGEVGGKAVSSY